MKAFPYRLAAIDIDNTLLGPDKRISAANAEAIQALRDRDVLVLLASGRRRENMAPFCRELNLTGPVVSCQGALAHHATTDEIYHRQYLPVETACRLIAEGESLGMTIVYYHTDAVFVRERTPWAEFYERHSGGRIEVCGDLARLQGDQALKVLWVETPERITAQHCDNMARYQGLWESYITEPEYIEFMARGVDKYVGIEAVALRHGIDRSEILTFGDAYNDLGMLRWAGMGIAMSHATPEAKSAARRVAPDGDPETSLARAITSLFDAC